MGFDGADAAAQHPVNNDARGCLAEWRAVPHRRQV